MRWFEGAIIDAVNAAKLDKKLMIVYIHGKDEQSKEMLKTFEDESVSSRCEGSHVVALKLEADSVDCVQFSSIYPVICVPSTFFVSGHNGISLEIIGGNVDAAGFTQTFDKILDTHNKSLHTPVEQKPETTDESQPSSSAAATSSPVAATSQADDSAALAERVRRAEELLQEKKRLKAQEEFEKERQKEKERIQLGKDMAKLKQSQAEMEAAELREEMKRAKREERLARERVREQIARDRAERAQKYQAAKDAESEQKAQKREAAAREQDAHAQRLAQERSAHARIQIRLPDGSAQNHEFSADMTLAALRQFVADTVAPGIGPFSLGTMFPRQTFTEHDEKATLRELQLSPSAVVIVMPGGSASSHVARPSAADGGGIMALLMAPLLWLWSVVTSLFSSAPPREQPTSSGAASRGQARPDRESRAREGARLRHRQEGNVHRLHADDEDDESATWNGNSTQQM